MTKPNDKTPDDTGALKPQLQVNVISPEEVQKYLGRILGLMRGRPEEPVVFGEANKPEAVILPFSDYMQYLALKQDADDREEAFQAEIHRRINSDEPPMQFTSLEEFAASLGPLGAEWAAEQRAARDE
jgi:hypothetical protein